MDRDAGDSADAAIGRLVRIWAADPRIVAAFLGGSRARGEADRYSDIDISVIVRDESYEEITSGKRAFAEALGEPLFVEDFGNEQVAFVVLADGTDLELHLFRVSEVGSIRSGPFRVLLDERGVLEGREFPLPDVDQSEQAEQLGRLLMWFWHDLEHFVTAMGRGQLWWAAGQLEQLRQVAINVARIHQGVAVEDEPSWKLDEEIDVTGLAALRSTFVPLDRDALLAAGREVVEFVRSTGRSAAATHDLTYPDELDRLVGGRLGALGDRA